MSEVPLYLVFVVGGRCIGETSASDFECTDERRWGKSMRES